MVAGNPWWLPNCPEASMAPADRGQGVVLALCQGALIGAGAVTGVPVHTRRLVVGVARAGGGPGGHDGVEGGAALRVEQAGDLAHPVGALRADGDPAAPGPVEVGVVAVGVQQGQQPGGGLAQPVGELLARDPGQGGVGVFAGGEVDGVG